MTSLSSDPIRRGLRVFGGWLPGWRQLRSDPVLAARLVLSALWWPLAVAATILAAAPFFPVFTGVPAVPILVAAAVMALVVPASVGSSRRAAPWSVPASLVGYLVFTLLFVAGGPLHFADLARGFAEGGARLLSTTLPVAGPRWLLVVPVTVVWLVGSASAELLVRRRSAGAASACWIAGFAIATAGAAGGPGRSTAPAVALLAVMGMLVFTRRWVATASLARADIGGDPASAGALQLPHTGELPDGGGLPGGLPGGTGEAEAPWSSQWGSWPGSSRRQDPMPMRPLAFGAATLAVATVLSAVLVPRLPGLEGSPVAPARQPPVRSVQPITPTDAVASLREADPTAPATPEFTVRVSGPFDGYLDLAVLDSYNGDTWSMDRTFVPTGGRVPRPVGAPTGGETVVQRYHMLRALPMPWMPTVDRVVSVSGVGVDYNATSAMVVPSAPLPAGATYLVVSRAPVDTLATMPASSLRRPPAGSPDPADLAVAASVQPDLGAVIDSLATQTGQAPAPTLVFLAAVEAEFRSHYGRIDPAASKAAAAAATAGGTDEGGTAFAEVVHAVMTLHQATPEQYATLFALVARQLGVPARLVTGFRAVAPGAAPAPQSRSRRLTVTNREAWTWVEIPVAGLGWVVADPSPLAVTTPAVPAVSEGPGSTTPPSSAHAVAVSNNGHAVAAPVGHRRRSSSRSWWWWLVVAAATVVVLALGLVASAMIRRWRRRVRRRRGSPERQVLGAWHEMLDMLDESRCSGLGPLTASEVAAVAGERFGSPARSPVAQVGALADLVLFSSSRAGIDAAAADEAWQAVRQLGTACRHGRSRRQRVRALASVARGDPHP